MSEAHYARIADLYDRFVTTQADVPFFVEEAGAAGGEVLELMCGTGRLTIPLVKAGVPLTCVDFSPAMLDRLRNRLAAEGLSAAVHEMDIRDLKLDRQFRQIIIPFQAFPELTAEADQRRALARIREHLTDDGVFICTLHNPPVRLRSVDGQLHLAGKFPLEQGQLFVWLLQRHDPATHWVDVLEFFEEYDPDGALRAKRFSELQFHLMEKADFEALIAAAGFEVAALYGDYSRAPFDDATSPFMIWLLRPRQ